MSVRYTLLTARNRDLPQKLTIPASSSQEIPRVLWNLKVHYRIYKRPPPVPILDHINPFGTSLSHFLKINFNIALPSMPRPSKWSLSLRPTHEKPVCSSLVSHSCHMLPPFLSSWCQLGIDYWNSYGRCKVKIKRNGESESIFKDTLRFLWSSLRWKNWEEPVKELGWSAMIPTR